MTQPQNVSMLVCNDCGSVRVPVPAITSKIVVLNGPPSVTPCPVCWLTKTLKDAMREATEVETETADEIATTENVDLQRETGVFP